jgi:hypothetical protein
MIKVENLKQFQEWMAADSEYWLIPDDIEQHRLKISKNKKSSLRWRVVCDCSLSQKNERILCAWPSKWWGFSYRLSLTLIRHLYRFLKMIWPNELFQPIELGMEQKQTQQNCAISDDCDIRINAQTQTFTLQTVQFTGESRQLHGITAIVVVRSWNWSDVRFQTSTGRKLNGCLSVVTINYQLKPFFAFSLVVPDAQI